MTLRHLPVVVAVVLAFGLVGAAAAPALAEFCRPVMPDHAQDASGYTFDARVLTIRTEGVSPRLTYVTMSVTRVYANRDSKRLREGGTIEIYSNPCDGFALLGLREGEQILVSTGSLEAVDGPGTWNTVVWRREAGSLHLLILRGEGFGKVWFTDDRRTADAGTTREALALVAPGAAGVPNTATSPVESGRAPVLPLFFAGLAGLLVSLLRFGPRPAGLRRKQRGRRISEPPRIPWRPAAAPRRTGRRRPAIPGGAAPGRLLPGA